MNKILPSAVLTPRFDASPVPDDLTPEEQQELEHIRRRKQELLEDIQVKKLLLYSCLAEHNRSII